MQIYDTPTKIRRTWVRGALTGALVTWIFMLGVSYVWIERSKNTTRFIDEQRRIQGMVQQMDEVK